MHLTPDDGQLPLGQTGGAVELVGGEEHRRSVRSRLADEAVDQVAAGGVEPGMRLVQQPQLRRTADEHGQGGAATLPGGEPADDHVGQPVVEAEAAEGGIDRGDRGAGSPDGEAEVVEDRQLLVQEAVVAEQADGAAEAAALTGQIVPQHLGLACDHPEEAGAGAEERALAGSVRPGQVDDLSSIDEEVGTSESGEPAEQDDGSGQTDGGRHGIAPIIRPPPWQLPGSPAAPTRRFGAGTLAPHMDVRRIIAGIGRTCIASGLLILLFVAYQLWGTGLAEARSQDRLRSDFLDALEAPAPTTSSTAPTAAVPGETTTTKPPAPPTPTGDAVAIIRIPKIDVEKAVVEGVSVDALKQGPGHYPTTPMPGQPGNAAIAGHRTTYGAPFYRLDELAPGDPILVTTRQGEFTYEVRESKIVKPTQNEVLDPSEENLLTLTTCNPRFSAAQRLIIIAVLVDEPAPAPDAPPATVPTDEPVDEPADELVGEPLPGEEVPGNDPVVNETPTLDDPSVSGDPAAKGPAILWGALAALVWLVTWLLSKRWGRLTAYGMGTPVFLVVLFVFFENFARLLPANV